MKFFTALLLAWMVSADLLQEMPIYELENEKQYYLRAEYCKIKNSQFEMNGRCYSFSTDGKNFGVATSPGPTLKMIAGTQVKITLVNNFINTGGAVDADACHNQYCGMDVTNIHTHGLHISSSEDDVLRTLPPRRSQSDAPNTVDYDYTLLDNHYPGIHWYHPHYHGSVSHQIHFGMFGALITEYPNDSKYVNDKKLYTGGTASDSYITNILVFSSVYAVNTRLCNCAVGLTTLAKVNIQINKGEGAGAYGRCAEHGKDCFHQYSACYEYCAYPDRVTSAFEYETEIIGSNNDGDNIDQFVLVNGQYNPELQISVGKFRRLQLLNAITQYYIHYQFPGPTECQVYLLGYDGVFIDINDDFPRNLHQYNNELILSPGSRGDLLIKCDKQTQYKVTTISIPGQSSMDETQFDALERIGSDEADGIKNLFTINVVADVGDKLSDQPTAIPDKPEYLKDLRSESVDNNCACNQYTAVAECSSNDCCIQYNSKVGFEVNGEEFAGADRYLTYLIQDKVYEFKLIADRHVHHQHVYPFQIQANIGVNGFIGKAGDFFDTIGAERGSDDQQKIRMHTADFSGYMVLHCHILPHEDEGMMALFYVLSKDQAEQNAPSPNPTASPIPLNQCLPDLNAGTARSFSVPTPSTTQKTKGRNRNGDAMLLDVNLNPNEDNTLLVVVLAIFIVLTLFNTVVIIYKHLLPINTARNKKYVAVVQNEMDDL